jgi:hypothetical protein
LGNKGHDPTLKREAVENYEVGRIGYQRYLAPVIGYEDTVLAHARMHKRHIPVVQRDLAYASEDPYAARNRGVLISDRR